jgi:hypothetical protein
MHCSTAQNTAAAAIPQVSQAHTAAAAAPAAHVMLESLCNSKQQHLQLHEAMHLQTQRQLFSCSSSLVIISHATSSASATTCMLDVASAHPTINQSTLEVGDHSLI